MERGVGRAAAVPGGRVEIEAREDPGGDRPGRTHAPGHARLHVDEELQAGYGAVPAPAGGDTRVAELCREPFPTELEADLGPEAVPGWQGPSDPDGDGDVAAQAGDAVGA